MNPIKISGGIFFILLSVILLSIFQSNIGSTKGIIFAVAGAFSAAIGFGLIAWDISK